MKRNLTVLLLVLALALSLVSPAMAVESEDTSAPVTWGELTADSPDLTLPVTGEPDQAVTNQEAVAYLLRWAGKGHFSEDILALKRCLCCGGGEAERLTAMERVASFGSSSGCDFLTGFYFGLLDTNSTGGKRLEET